MKSNKIINSHFLFLFYFLNLSVSVSSQNTLESSRGNTSIDYNQYGGGVFSINPADKKIELGYINYKFRKQKIEGSISQLENRTIRPYFYGFNVSGKAENGYSTIFSNGKISPTTKFNLKFGYRIREFNSINHNLPIIKAIEKKDAERANCGNNDKNCKEIIDIEIAKLLKTLKASPELWLIGRGGYEVTKFKLYDSTRPFSDQFQSNRFVGLNGTVSLNYWHPNLFRANIIFLAGLSVGIKNQNNLSNLTEISADDVITIDNPPNITRSIKSQNIGFLGNYSTSTSIPINFDLYFKPHKLENAALSIYGRIDSYKENESKRQTPTNLGIGFYLLNENWLAHPVGGITFELEDVFRTVPNSSASFKDRLVINILVRVNILKLREE